MEDAVLPYLPVQRKVERRWDANLAYMRLLGVYEDPDTHALGEQWGEPGCR
jgi:hypothetical protein